MKLVIGSVLIALAAVNLAVFFIGSHQPFNLFAAFVAFVAASTIALQKWEERRHDHS